MFALRHHRLSLAVAFALVSASPFASAARPGFDYEDHYEFDAMLSAPYVAADDSSRRSDLSFRFLVLYIDSQVVVWRLDIVNDAGSKYAAR